jgi:UDP-glucuronate decarboxylase
VDDLVEGLIRLMETPDTVTGPVNLGNPSESMILDLAQKIIALTGSRSRIVLRPLPADDPRQRNPDISQARELLNWEPRIPLEEGLLKTISYFEGRTDEACEQFWSPAARDISARMSARH